MSGAQGQAAVAQHDLLEVRRRFGDRMRHVHLSDNAGKGWDSHLPPGQGVLALDAFLACQCEGMARIDMFISDAGDIIVNEINTIPGFTETSVYAKLFEASGVAYPQLLDRLIELALERHREQQHLRH